MSQLLNKSLIAVLEITKVNLNWKKTIKSHQAALIQVGTERISNLIARTITRVSRNLRGVPILLEESIKTTIRMSQMCERQVVTIILDHSKQKLQLQMLAPHLHLNPITSFIELLIHKQISKKTKISPKICRTLIRSLFLRVQQNLSS